MDKKERLKWYSKEFDKISDSIKNKACLSYLDFLRVRNFKLQNLSREEESHIKEITEQAFNLAEKDKIEESIKKLLELNGVAIPIASTILAMKFPNRYAIIDRIVITQLGKKHNLKNYMADTKIYKSYLLLIRELAKKNNMNLRDYERSLFEA